MGVGLYIGNASNLANKMTKGYVGGDDTKAHTIEKVYIGDSNNKAQLAYTNIPPVEYEICWDSVDEWTVPEGVHFIDIWCLGGGAGYVAPSTYTQTSTDRSGVCYAVRGCNSEYLLGGAQYNMDECAWGGSGKVDNKYQVAVTPGEKLTIDVGSGGSDGTGRQYYEGSVVTRSQSATSGTRSRVTVRRNGSDRELAAAAGGTAPSTPLDASTNSPPATMPTDGSAIGNLFTKGGNGGSGGANAGYGHVVENYNTGTHNGYLYILTAPAHGYSGGDGTDSGMLYGWEDYETFSQTMSYDDMTVPEGQGIDTRPFEGTDSNLSDIDGDNFCGGGGCVIIRYTRS